MNATATQTRYAEQIAGWFARHGVGVDVDVDAVLADMDTWVDRHTAAKGGHAYLGDAGRADADAEIHRLRDSVRTADEAYTRATYRLRDARRRRHLDAEAYDDAHCDGLAARQHLTDVRAEARRAVAALIDRHGPAYEYEIRLIAGRAGI